MLSPSCNRIKCFANEEDQNGQRRFCQALQDTKFEGPCPFYQDEYTYALRLVKIHKIKSKPLSRKSRAYIKKVMRKYAEG